MWKIWELGCYNIRDSHRDPNKKSATKSFTKPLDFNIFDLTNITGKMDRKSHCIRFKSCQGVIHDVNGFILTLLANLFLLGGHDFSPTFLRYYRPEFNHFHAQLLPKNVQKST